MSETKTVAVIIIPLLFRTNYHSRFSCYGPITIVRYEQHSVLWFEVAH